MLRKLLRAMAIGVAALAALIAVVAFIARFLDGPIFVFPGGRLVAGRSANYSSIAWTDLASVREIEFQLESPARSRITRMTIYNNTPYVPCAFCTNKVLKQWPRQLEVDDRVVIRVNGMLIEGRARRVPQDSAEYKAARQAHLAKYASATETLNVVESGAAKIVVGAGQVAPGHGGASRTDSWMYRIDPR